MDESKLVISAAVAALQSGQTLLYPTDTIWGVGCDATNATAVEKIYAVKQRDHSKSMLVLCADIAMVERYVGQVVPGALPLLTGSERPTTVIMPCRGDMLAGNLVAVDGTIGVRIPRLDFCQSLLRLFGRPIVSTSANFSGMPSPSAYKEIDDSLKRLVDYCVPPQYEEGGDMRSSRIVKIGSDGGIVVLRG